MNERNTVLIAILLIAGLSFFSAFDNLTGNYVAGKAECKYISDTSIFNPTSISYDADVNDGVPPKILASTCSTDTTLSTVRCIDGSRPARYAVNCADGYVCSDGACVIGTVQERISDCSDSDGGKNIYQRGVTTLRHGRGINIPETQTDFCATEIMVTEKFCAVGGKSIGSEILRCPYPKTCSNGICA